MTTQDLRNGCDAGTGRLGRAFARHRDEPSGEEPWTRVIRRAQLVAPIGLVLAGAAVTGWRATTRAVLWDLSYILNYAYRITHGQLPYRDYPLPHPPGTFLIQAFLVKIGGPDYRLVVAYVVLAGAVSVALTFVITRVLVGERRHPTALAALLTSPVVVLGIYTVYPHPFYDPDTALFMLAGIAGVLVATRMRPVAVVSVPVGMLLVVPIFVKQNVGVAYFCLMHLALLTLLLDRSPNARRHWAYFVAGSVAALLGAAALIEGTVGMGNYLHWTVAYASERRLSSGLFDGMNTYRNPMLWWFVSAFVVGMAILRRLRTPFAVAVAVVLFAVGPAWFALEIRRGHELVALDLWPYGLALSCILALLHIAGRRPRFEDLLPFVVAGVAHASFLSQGVSGSTYGIWPFLVIAFASVTRRLPRWEPGRLDMAAAFPIFLASAFAFTGFVYFRTDERLSYSPRIPGPMLASSAPTLTGLHEQGKFLPDLDLALRYIEENIDEDDAFIALPGGDPLYFALDRPPKFPVLTFDPTVNPYSPTELAVMVRRHDVRWVFIKNGGDGPLDPVSAAVTEGFTLRTKFEGYAVYLRGELVSEQAGRATISLCALTLC